MNGETSRWYLGLIPLLIALSSLPARAQTPHPQPLGPAADPARPPLNPFPVEQKWSFLADSSKRTDFFDPVKYTPLHPVLQFQLRTNITGAVAWDWYWRESTHDGIYAFGSGVLIDPAGASHARYLGNQGDVEIRWAPVRHTIIAFNLAGFEPATFFNTPTYKAAPIAANVGFTYRF